MASSLMKRLEAVEKSLAPSRKLVVIWDWRGDSKEVREDKLARWRAGENVEGAPTDIGDRENVQVGVIRFVKPGEVDLRHRPSSCVSNRSPRLK